MDFDRLDYVLKEKGMSRRKLALAVGINPGTMSTAFMRKSGLSADDTLKIADFLRVSPYYLEGKTNDPLYTIVPIPFSSLDPDEQKRYLEWSRSFEARHEAEKKTQLIQAFNQLNDDGQSEAVNRVEEMTHIPKYMKGGGDHGNEA